MFNMKDLEIKIIDNDLIVDIKKSVVLPNNCARCDFFTGVKCQGHGDFWGTCTIYKFFGESLNSFADICYPQTPCLLKKELFK